MKIKRIAALLAVLFLSVSMLSGCNLLGENPEETTEGPLRKDEPFEPTESGLFIRDDGTVVGAEITDFAKEYYDLAELKTHVETLVAEYNQNKAGLNYAYQANAPAGKKLPVSIMRLTEANGLVTLMLDCQSAEDYISINDLNLMANGLKSLTNSTVAQWKNSGKALSVQMKAVDGSAVSVEKALSNETYYIVVCTGATKLQVQGEVKYMSENVTYVDVDSVETPAGEVSYIIYR